MTKRDFFRLLIRVFALYSIILTVFNWIPSNIVYLSYDLESPPILFGGLFFTFLGVLIFYLLIKKTDSIINVLKIDKGFDDQNINISKFDSRKVLMLGIILIGGFLFINNLSDFIKYVFIAFKEEVSKDNLYTYLDTNFGTPTDYLEWAFCGVNLLIGFLLLTNYSRISKWIMKNEKTT